MNPISITYPLDLSGSAVTNLVSGETHTIPREDNRTFAPNNGPFYAASVVLTTTTSTTPLVRGVDWLPLYLYQEATKLSGQEVCAAITVINPAIEGDLLIDYQVVGGPFSTSTDAIQQLFDSLQLDNRAISWDNILDKPVRFPPTPHMHDASDIYGMEHVVYQLHLIYEALLHGDEESHVQIYAKIDQLYQWCKEQFDQDDVDIQALWDQVNINTANIATNATNIAQVGEDLSDHIEDKANPHAVTKAQVGLSNVQNFGLATDTEAQQGLVNNKYMTPYLVAEYCTAAVTPVITAHIADHNNPHAVTKAQVGLGSVVNYAVATNTDAQTGTAALYLVASNANSVFLGGAQRSNELRQYPFSTEGSNGRSARVLSGTAQPSSTGMWTISNNTWTPEAYGILLVTNNTTNGLSPANGTWIQYLFIPTSNNHIWIAGNINATWSGWTELSNMADLNKVKTDLTNMINQLRSDMNAAIANVSNTGLQNVQLGPEINFGRSGESFTYRANSGCVVTGFYVSSSGGNEDNISNIYSKPIQKQVSGTWYTVSG